MQSCTKILSFQTSALFKIIFIAATLYFSGAAAARDDAEIQEQIAGLSSNNLNTISRSVKYLVGIKDDLDDLRPQIVKGSLQALIYLNKRLPIILIPELVQEDAAKYLLYRKDKLLHALLTLVPRDADVVSLLLDFASKSFFSQQDGKRALIGPPAIDILRQARDNWPLKAYLWDAVQHNPKFFDAALRARQSHTRLMAAAILILNDRLTIPTYERVLQKIIRRWESTPIATLRFFPQIARALNGAPSETNLKITELFRQDIHKLLQSYQRSDGMLDFPEVILHSIGDYAMTYTELHISGDSDLLEKLHEGLRGQLPEHSRQELKRALHYAKTGSRDLDEKNPAEAFIYQLQFEETRQETINILETDAGAHLALLEGLAITSPRDRQLYLVDVIRYGGDRLASLVVHNLIQMGGPDIEEEISLYQCTQPYLKKDP